MTESIVLCEGYHDRAFWGGFFLSIGCEDRGFVPNKPRVPVFDIWREKVVEGQFYYYSKGGNGIRVVPCHGKSQIPSMVTRFLNKRKTRSFDKLIVNIDDDSNSDGTSNGASSLSLFRITDLVRKVYPDVVISSEGRLQIDSGQSEIAMIQWLANDSVAPGLPNQQTLERLVCSAMIGAYPERAESVQTWLDQRPFPPSPGVKEYAYSYMAGWYAENGCDDFYRCLRDDPQIVEALKARLEESGAWKIALALAV